MKRIHCFIEGRVQKVRYRYWSGRKAHKLHLTGWVKNLKDGRVELVAEGKEEDLTKFVKELNHGPLFALVKHVDVSWEQATNEFSGYMVLWRG